MEFVKSVKRVLLLVLLPCFLPCFFLLLSTFFLPFYLFTYLLTSASWIGHLQDWVHSRIGALKISKQQRPSSIIHKLSPLLFLSLSTPRSSLPSFYYLIFDNGKLWMVDDQNCPIGVISLTDVMKLFSNRYASPLSLPPLSPSLSLSLLIFFL